MPSPLTLVKVCFTVSSQLDLLGNASSLILALYGVRWCPKSRGLAFCGQALREAIICCFSSTVTDSYSVADRMRSGPKLGIARKKGH